MDQAQQELQTFAAAFLDLERLRIIGELARGNGQVDSLAERVALTPEKVSAHLQVLAQTALVSRQPGDAYSLDAAALEAMSRRHFAEARRAADRREISPGFTPAEVKIIHSFTTPDGLITHLPAIRTHHKLITILRYGMQALEAGRAYTEKEINQALRQFTRDTASLRRYLVDYGYLARETDGSRYWLAQASGEAHHD
jgi:hypothetical protein